MTDNPEQPTEQIADVLLRVQRSDVVSRLEAEVEKVKQDREYWWGAFHAANAQATRLRAERDAALAKARDTLTATNSIVEKHGQAIDRLIQERDAARADAAALRVALRPLVDYEPCRFDHHGYCQTHYVSSPCVMVAARNALVAAGRAPGESA